MRLLPDICWRSGGRDATLVDARLLPLLREIRARTTLRAAAAAQGMSYRGAWDLLRAQMRLLGAPLVAMARGRGARLAPLGEQLLAADDTARLRLRDSHLAVEIGSAHHGAPAMLRVCASHDLLLAEYCGGSLDLNFRGSLECIRMFARGETDIAGFHLPPDPAAAAPYRAQLAARRDRLIRFAAREQGVMLASGSSKRVRDLGDVARLRLRFVNRQRGSGTRQLIDRLLAGAGIDPATLRGYADEEFTHVAVAATIAAGRADAGVGVRAAAARFGLRFVPLQLERYWLAVRLRALGESNVQQLLESLRADALQRLARRLTGYDARGAGEVLPTAALQETAG